MAQAKAMLERERANAVNAKKIHERSKDLYKDHLISEQEYEAAQAF